MVPLDSKIGSNLALFGTPWGGKTRGTRRLGEKKMRQEIPRFSFMGDKYYNMPWFARDEEEKALHKFPAMF